MYNNDSDSLNAGAPDIRLSGNQQMASAVDPMDALNDMSMDVLGKPLHELTPEEYQMLIDMANEQAKAPQQDLGIMAAAPGTYTQRRKQMMAYGGIAGADGRKKYGLGSFFQKYIKDPIEMAVTGKSPTQIENESQLRVDREQEINRPLPTNFDITKDRVADITPIGDPEGTGPYTPAYEKIFDPIRDAYGGITNALTQGNLTSFLPFTQRMTDEGQQGILPFGIQDFLNLRNLESLQPYLKKEIRPAVAAQAATKTFKGQDTGGEPIYETTPAIPEQAAVYEHRVNPLYPIAGGLGAGLYSAMLPRDELPMDQTGIDFSRFQTGEAAAADPSLRFKPIESARLAEGGRIGYQEGGIPNVPEEFLEDLKRKDLHKFLDKYRRFQDDYKRRRDLAPTQEAAEGGLMNLGGMEKDYRNEGGFVALGSEEKADDVPARLSKNEFVFTADAVRGAGDGDIDKGAEIMENLMDNLEGARSMFANAQKLKNRII